MTYYFIDYENVHAAGINSNAGLKAGDTIIIFFRKLCKHYSGYIGKPVQKECKRLCIWCLRRFKARIGFSTLFISGLLHSRAYKF